MSDFIDRLRRREAWPVWLLIGVIEFNAVLYLWRGELANLISVMVGFCILAYVGPTFLGRR